MKKKPKCWELRIQIRYEDEIWHCFSDKIDKVITVCGSMEII